MKKLLNILSSSGITISSSLSIISCFNSKISHNQPNKKDETLKDLASSNQQNEVIKTVVDQEKIGLNQQETVPIRTLSDQEKIDAAVKLLQTISNDEVGLTITTLNIVKLKEVIKTLEKYTNAVKDDVTLKDHSFVFEKPINTVLTSDSTIEINDIVTVKGTVQSGNKEKDFIFTVKIVDIEQKQVDFAVAKLNSINNQQVELANADLSVIKLKKVIKNLSEYKEAFNNNVALKNEFTLKKADKTVLNANSNLTHNDVITVQGIIHSGTKEKTFTFNIKIIDPDQKKINDALRILQSINKEEVGLTDSDLISDSKIRAKIKALQKYQDAIENVTLEKDLTLKNASGAIITTVAYQNIVTVEGTVKSGSKEKTFIFTVKIIDLNQKKIDDALILLQAINNEEIGLNESDLANPIVPLKIAIKTLTKYKNAVKDEIILKEDNFIFEKSDKTVLTSTSTVAIDDVITVKGKVQFESKEKDFIFTIKVVDLDQQKVNSAVKKLNKISGEYIELASTDLNIEKLTSATKALQEYQNAIKEVQLEGNLIFKKPNGANITTIANEEIITVQGKIKSGNKEKDFTFKVTVIDINLLEVDVAVMKLQFIKNEKVELLPTDLTVEKLKHAIKNLPRYQSIFKESITLKQDFTLEKIARSVLDPTASVENNDIITVKGTVQSGTVEKNFKFTVKVKEKLTDQQKIDATVIMLNAIEKIISPLS